MNNRRKTALVLRTTSNTKLEVSVFFSDRKQYVLTVCPFETKGEYNTHFPFDAQMTAIESAPRFNAKRLDQLASQAKDMPVLADIVQNVVHKLNLTLADPADIAKYTPEAAAPATAPAEPAALAV